MWHIRGLNNVYTLRSGGDGVSVFSVYDQRECGHEEAILVVVTECHGREEGRAVYHAMTRTRGRIRREWQEQL